MDETVERRMRVLREAREAGRQERLGMRGESERASRLRAPDAEPVSASHPIPDS